ncbi:GGDEF domain-containing protein [Pseudomonadota bacterium]
MNVVAQEDLNQPRYDRLGNLALSMPLPDSTESSEDLEKALRLSGMLQTTLEVTKIIEIVAHEISKLVDYQYINYIHQELDITHTFGKPSTHSCTYRLIVCGEALGELVLSRRKKFAKIETTLLETLLCGVVYPLRNALLYQKALEAAHRDPLTGVNNRASMDTSIEREITLAHRHKTNLSLLTMDIDHFKNINDTYGHTMGDCVIKAIAEAATAAIRSSDMIFRFGGEEFVILLSNTDQAGATLLADRLRQKIEETCIICDGTQVSATVSIGYTCLQEKDTSGELFSRADTALYQAKAAGRNCCKLFIQDND